ncbi:tetratricopeptide repeat protein [Algibacillus agarilyticus]|uniref:tetratricopeptide repeat protein n=1 Tax=Algibacillus agarilyticus TaxID=2234133 RepID=UPI000DCFFC0F|nr:SEL1-like repeat protein [Algibacillus agarilyticus]
MAIQLMTKWLAPVLIATSLSISVPVFCADVLKADKHYNNKAYSLALKGYLEAAKVGNPHAYYQLGTMYNKGLGVEVDALNSLIYLSMAAEYDFHDSSQIIANMFAKLKPEVQAEITAILTKHMAENGKSKIEKQYFPQLIIENLSKKITFEGQAELETQFYADDYMGDEFSEMNSLADDEESTDDFYMPMSTPKKGFVIIDHDVAQDGSVRNITDVQKMGLSQSLIKNYALFPSLKPTFEGKPVEFVNRVTLGAANYNKFTLLDEDPTLYKAILKAYKKLKTAESLHDQYLLAMALQNFKWLEQKEGEVEQRLLEVAEQGHPGAMYEYGYKLLREQQDIKQAIKWISLASSYGLARAEYRLGKLLMNSPWVVKDEKKALFWFESATQKDHMPAILTTIDLLINAKDKSIRDLNRAIDMLAEIEKQQYTNPEYFYLAAMSHINRKNRDYTQVISNLERAIFLGSNANWDVSDWEELLIKLTQGTVYITE